MKQPAENVFSAGCFVFNGLPVSNAHGIAETMDGERGRPTGEQLIGYDYGYLSTALNPGMGEMFALLLPDMRIESFQAFPDEFLKFIGEQSFARLITDGVAHRSTRLKAAERLIIELLPPYSPESNPVERLFKELRRELKNRVFGTLAAVEKAIIEAVKPYLNDGSRVKKLTFCD